MSLSLSRVVNAAVRFMRSGRLGLLLLVALVATQSTRADGVKFFRTHSRAEFLDGEFDGIGVDGVGTLRLADRARRVTAVEEPFLFAAAPHPLGWVVGTGNGGKVLLIDRQGAVSELFTAEEPEIFAVWADADGTVYAGSSPNGKVYRIRDGGGEIFFDPGETYIWALAMAPDGQLLVATGTEGKLYQIDRKGTSSVLFDSEDTHLRALKVLAGGQILLGTADQGFILKVDAKGNARTLFDAEQSEVLAFAVAPDGSSYAAVVESEASRLPSPAIQNSNGGKEKDKEGDNGTAGTEVTVTMTPSSAGNGRRKGRRPGVKRSEVLRISPSGLVESVWSFEDETAFSLLWHRDRLWVGTGLDGKLFSFSDGRMVLEKDVAEKQVVALLPGDPGPDFATTNAASLYEVLAESERSGSYTSPTLDARQISRFGTLSWRGERSKGSELRFSARSGMSFEPDPTWSAWIEGKTRDDVDEISLAQIPPGRYVQWRAEMGANGGESPVLREVRVSYRQENLAPRITSFTAMEPGEIVVAGAFNPQSQVYEPVHPNRDGIFTTIRAAQPAREERRLKTLWKQGFRTLRWQAEDANEDELEYELSFRPEGKDVGWLRMVEELSDDFYSFDSTVLPDGVYRFQLSARDRRAGVVEGRRVEEISVPVVVDHTPPELSSRRRAGSVVYVVVEDRLNPLRRAEMSLDAKEWKPIVPRDGLLDGQSEELRISVPQGASLLLLRVSDAAFNSRTFDLLSESQ